MRFAPDDGAWQANGKPVKIPKQELLHRLQNRVKAGTHWAFAVADSVAPYAIHDAALCVSNLFDALLNDGADDFGSGCVACSSPGMGQAVFYVAVWPKAAVTEVEMRFFAKMFGYQGPPLAISGGTDIAVIASRGTEAALLAYLLSGAEYKIVREPSPA